MRQLERLLRTWPSSAFLLANFSRPGDDHLAMTTILPDVQRTPQLLEARPPKLRRSWLVVGALGVFLGLGYHAGKAAYFWGVRPPAPDRTTPLPVALSGKDETDSSPAAPMHLPQRSTANAADTEEDSEPEATPIDRASSGAFYVQVASYKGKNDAAHYASTLSARGLPAESTGDPASAAWHLVRLGPFPTRGDAEKARFELKLHERGKAYVVPRSNGKYHVQVGSFASRQQAETVAERFAAQGHATKISRIKMGERRWHCARIGPFDTEQEAADYQELVKGVSGSESVVIPYGPPSPKEPRS